MLNIYLNRNNEALIIEGLTNFLETWFGKNLNSFFIDFDLLDTLELPPLLKSLYQLGAPEFMNFQNSLFPPEELHKENKTTWFLEENQSVWTSGFQKTANKTELCFKGDSEDFLEKSFNDFLIDRVFEELCFASRFFFEAEGMTCAKIKKEILWIEKLEEFQTVYSWFEGVIIVETKSQDFQSLTYYSMTDSSFITEWEKNSGYDKFQEP